MNHRIRACMAFALLMWQAPTLPAQVYDCTVSGELADVPGIVRLPLTYHLWNLGQDAQTIPRAVWQPAFDRAAGGLDVGLDIEPPLSPRKDWQRPVDPAKAPIAEVTATHRTIAQQLAPLCEVATDEGARVWLYGLYPPTHANAEHIVNDPREWQRHSRSAVKLEYAEGQSLAKLLKPTGGGVLYEVYVPDGWNRPESWALTKCVLLLERQAELLRQCNVRAIPLLNFYTVGGATSRPVRTEIMQALIFAGKARGRIAVWNGWIDGRPEFPAITKEQKALLR